MPQVKGYSLREVAEAASRSTATIVRWIETGKVRITKKKTSSGHYFFTEADKQKIVTYANRIKEA